jgi:hypothetical protein
MCGGDQPEIILAWRENDEKMYLVRQ